MGIIMKNGINYSSGQNTQPVPITVTPASADITVTTNESVRIGNFVFLAFRITLTASIATEQEIVTGIPIPVTVTPITAYKGNVGTTTFLLARSSSSDPTLGVVRATLAEGLSNDSAYIITGTYYTTD